jgi:hypothetical protein
MGNNIEIELRELALEGVVEWIHLAQNKGVFWAVVNVVMNIHVL